MRAERKQLTGKTIGNRYVIGEPIEIIRPNGKKQRKEKCRCNLCGKEKYVDRQHLLKGETTSCGCRIEKIKKGDIFGKRTAIKNQEGDKVKCRCECGTIRYVRAAALKRGGSLCCGCNHEGHKIHGLHGTHFYNKYQHAKARCENPNCERYKNYGGRGIKIERNTFNEFKNDMYESYVEHVNKYGEKNTTLDRIDVNGNYCKENCRRATWKEQMNNTQKSKKVEYEGVVYNSVSELCEKIGRQKDVSMIGTRIRRGMCVEDAVLTPNKFNVKKI